MDRGGDDINPFGQFHRPAKKIITIFSPIFWEGREIDHRFDKNIWYKIKLQVTHENVTGWVDGEKLVDFAYA